MTAVDKPVQAALISVTTALLFPAALILLRWPLGLNGIWLNMPAASILAGLLSIVILLHFRRNMHKTPAPLPEDA